MVSFERLLSSPASILEPVPEEVRSKYGLWRGAHLGRIGLNLLTGSRSISAGPKTHFADRYVAAHDMASFLAYPINDFSEQWRQEDLELARELLGDNIAIPSTSMVLALDEQYNDPSYEKDWKSFSGGKELVLGDVTLDMLDPFSRDYLSDYFDI